MDTVADMYLELLKRCLLDALHEPLLSEPGPSGMTSDVYKESLRARRPPLTEHAVTMIGMKRLDNLQDCIEKVIDEGVPGDLIETGVWRGGATILMRAVLRANDEQDRVVWVADSFEGLPPPDPALYPADAGSKFHELKHVAISLEQVRGNFARYGLLDDQVRFLKGWFRDTLPSAPIGGLALLRLDADMYGSTMEALNALYPKLNAGGYIIVDDYGMFEPCRRAVNDYRNRHGITEHIVPIDAEGVFWKKAAASALQSDSGPRGATAPLSEQDHDRARRHEIPRGRLNGQEREIQMLTARLASKDELLQEIQSSQAWRLITAFRRFRLAVLPPGSLGERVWYGVLGRIRREHVSRRG